MRAAVVTEHGDRSKLAYREDYPDPVAAHGEVLLRVRACSLNFHDIFSRRGMPGIKIPMPLITGSDISGEIASVGPGVEDWKPGDRVMVDPIITQGDTIGLIGEVRDGGRAEYMTVHHSQLIALPEQMSFEQGAALPIAYGTAYRMMITQGRIEAGETVLILGASGGVGVAAVQIAKLRGAHVVACASSAEKLQQLRDIGADEVINYRENSIHKAVWERFGKPRVGGGGGVDVAVNFTGGDTWFDTQRCVRAGGRILTCGATAGFDVQQDMRFLWTFEHHVIGSNGWQRSDLAALVDLVCEGKLAPVISGAWPLAEASEVERMMEDREVFGKVLLVP